MMSIPQLLGKHIYQAEDAFVPSLPIPETKVRVVSSLLKPGHKIGTLVHESSVLFSLM